MAYNFDGIENAEIFDKGSYLPPDGLFYLKVNRVLVKKTQKGDMAFIAELIVIKSEHPDVLDGVKKSWYQSLTNTNVAFPAILEFMSALLGVNKDDKEAFDEFKTQIQEILKVAGSFEGEAEDHPLHGETVKVTTYNKLTLKQTDFTVHDWGIWREEDGFD